MKQFISTKLFLALQEASQKNTDIDVHALENSYGEFANLLFKGCTAVDKSAYHSILVYTRVELANLTGVSGKKCLVLPCQGYSTD
jgi:hypothetical protein